jgi:hypothetical protein
MRTLLPGCALISLETIVVLLSIPPSTASADGVDVVWLMTRVGGWRLHPALSVAMVVGCRLDAPELCTKRHFYRYPRSAKI